VRITNIFKIVFDFIMLALLGAIYCVQTTGMAFHEYVGLGIYLLFIIHLVYNYKWIKNVSKRIFDKSLGMRIKVMYAVDLLLLVAFLLIGLSGIMISHIIFHLEKMPLWRQVHTVGSAISVILLAVHIGLHGNMIINAIKSKIKIPFVAVKIFSATVFVIMIAAGIYGDIALTSQPIQNGRGQRPRYETVLSLFKQSITLLVRPPEQLRISNLWNKSDRENTFGRGDGGEGFNHFGGNEGDHFDGPPPKQKFSIMSLFVSVSNYIAFIILFSIIVYIIDSNLKKKKRPPSMAVAS
jgi:hypothetical protein